MCSSGLRLTRVNVNERKTKPITRLGRGYKPLLYSRFKSHRGLRFIDVRIQRAKAMIPLGTAAPFDSGPSLPALPSQRDSFLNLLIDNQDAWTTSIPFLTVAL
jgi:hypothetical protein